MSLRNIVFILYCALLAAGALWIVQRNRLAHIDFVAARDLPLGRLLQAGDVVPADWDILGGKARIGEPAATDFVGRYVGGDVPKGALVSLEGTASVPLPAAKGGQVALLAALPRSRLTDINAGSCVRLKLKDTKPFAVRTILCPAAAQADCAAIIDVPLERLAAIDAAPVTVDTGVPCS